MPSIAESESAYGLAFETSGACGGIALGRGARLLGTRLLSGPQRHAAQFLPTVAALCKEQSVRPGQVGGVYVSSGPGSFTGLRIALTAARMLALATGASIVPVPTLEVIAQNAAEAHQQPDRVAVILDAKRSRVYAATFVRHHDRYVCDTGPVEADPSEFLAIQYALDPSSAVLGRGVFEHRKSVEASGLVVLEESLHDPRAETVYRLGRWRADEGWFADRRTVVPIYVRPPEAEEKWAQRQRDRPT